MVSRECVGSKDAQTSAQLTDSLHNFVVRLPKLNPAVDTDNNLLVVSRRLGHYVGHSTPWPDRGYPHTFTPVYCILGELEAPAFGLAATRDVQRLCLRTHSARITQESRRDHKHDRKYQVQLYRSAYQYSAIRKASVIAHAQLNHSPPPSEEKTSPSAKEKTERETTQCASP